MNKLTIFTCLWLGTTCAMGATSGYAGANTLDSLSLDQAVHIALQNHRSLQVSQAALDMAQGQYRQAMSAFGLQVGLEAGFQRADENRTFSFDGTVMTPSMDVSSMLGAPPGSVKLPSQALPMNLDVKLFDRDVTRASVNLNYPLYTGGKKAAVTAMAQKGVAIAREEQRRTELEVVRDVSRYYHGARLAQQMEQLTHDAVERFQALEDLTDRLYKGASLKVKKTDYLRSRTVTAVSRTLLHEMHYASTLAREALLNAMGLALNQPFSLAPENTSPAYDAALDTLIADAALFNPDKQRLELAVQAADLKMDEVGSNNKPMVGLEASTYKIWNSYKGGLFNDANNTGWTIGVGVKWNVFDSGVTKAGQDVTRANKMKLENQRLLLDSGLALQIKDDFMRMKRSREQVQENSTAHGFATENRILHEQAYQEAMVETKDVIEAQTMESFTGAALYRARFELRSAMADLDFRVGRTLKQRLSP